MFKMDKTWAMKMVPISLCKSLYYFSFSCKLFHVVVGAKYVHIYANNIHITFTFSPLLVIYYLYIQSPFSPEQFLQTKITPVHLQLQKIYITEPILSYPYLSEAS
jgi:hypothetical protein